MKTRPVSEGEGVQPPKEPPASFQKVKNTTNELAKKIIIPVKTEGKVTPLPNRVVEKSSQLHEKIHTATRPK